MDSVHDQGRGCGRVWMVSGEGIPFSVRRGSRAFVEINRRDRPEYGSPQELRGAKPEKSPVKPLDDTDGETDAEDDTVDLHGLTVEQALRRVAQALHAARVRGRKRLLLITGAGWGNPDQKPVLRPRLEAWLRSPEGRALGVKDVQRAHRDGALQLRLN
jgi:DNA-nicking Smr family endonuclease